MLSTQVPSVFAHMLMSTSTWCLLHSPSYYNSHSESGSISRPVMSSEPSMRENLSMSQVCTCKKSLHLSCSPLYTLLKYYFWPCFLTSAAGLHWILGRESIWHIQLAQVHAPPLQSYLLFFSQYTDTRLLTKRLPPTQWRGHNL
jgi:hypothetical protein